MLSYEQKGREATLSVGILDSQSVKTAKSPSTNGRLGAGHCKAFRPCSEFCPAVKAMDRGADIRMARKMPPPQPRCRSNTPSLTGMAHCRSYPQSAAKNHSDRFSSQALWDEIGALNNGEFLAHRNDEGVK